MAGWASELLGAAAERWSQEKGLSWAGPGKRICFSGVRRGVAAGKRRILELSASLGSEVSLQALRMTVFPKQTGSPSKMSFCFHFSHKISERERHRGERYAEGEGC